jgi:hypothetical protein
MKLRVIIIEIICILFIVLFVYAAVSKIIDVSKFKVQVGLSPLLTAFADWVVWGIPSIEILLALMLSSRRLRLIGLFGSFGLMVIFTTYIIAILEFSDFVPCSCGGILETLGWKEHLIFNLFFACLAVVGITLESRNRSEQFKVPC